MPFEYRCDTCDKWTRISDNRVNYCSYCGSVFDTRKFGHAKEAYAAAWKARMKVSNQAFVVLFTVIGTGLILAFFLVRYLSYLSPLALMLVIIGLLIFLVRSLIKSDKLFRSMLPDNVRPVSTTH
ncbi:hypothetical protein KW791_03730 [Candidatus Parcubacteria bacterium]|nr:hypothetical protein [Candidatus Parcubacteria bacterium]